MTMSNNNARVILALAAEADDEFIWEQLKVIQAEMFAVGSVQIKFAYFGREGALETRRPCITTNWITDADEMQDVMNRGRAGCVCGCYVNVRDIIEQALYETRRGPVQAVVIVGDRFHGDLDQTLALAKQLRKAGTRLFLFQQGHSSQTERVFRTLAEETTGAYFQFNPAIERVAERLPGIFEAVTHFAIGGTEALTQAPENESAVLLLEQMFERQGISED
jgi:hypothetical protein